MDEADPFGRWEFSSIRWEEADWINVGKLQVTTECNYKNCRHKTHSFQELSKN